MELVRSKLNLNLFLISLLIPLFVGLLCIALIRQSALSFSQLVLPPFALPLPVSGILWGILYFAMGISFYMVARTACEETPMALSLYVVQLFFNVVWCILFFALESYFPAFITAVLLACLVLLMLAWFLRVHWIAGLIQLPYTLWVLYWAILSLGIYLFN